jgi:hypothetical protein
MEDGGFLKRFFKRVLKNNISHEKNLVNAKSNSSIFTILLANIRGLQ